MGGAGAAREGPSLAAERLRPDLDRPSDLMFSEVKNGLHMAIVRRAKAGRTLETCIFRQHESAMAHRSYVVA